MIQCEAGYCDCNKQPNIQEEKRSTARQHGTNHVTDTSHSYERKESSPKVARNPRCVMVQR